MKPTDNMTEEEIREEREKCLKEMVVMANMVKTWRESLVRNARRSAPKEGYDGWEFLVEELSDEILTHIEPYASRFYQCGYMTRDEIWSWLARVEEEKARLTEDLEILAEEGREIEREKNSLKYRLKRRLLKWLA